MSKDIKNEINIQKFRVLDWFKVKGDETLRLDYDLNEDSIVFDVGGYHGDWADAIFQKYGCEIHVFEPIKKYADAIGDRFAGNKKIHVYQIGLAGTTEKMHAAVLEDATSIFKEDDENTEEIELVEALEFIKQYNINKIALLKINIEGGEYALLQNLIDGGFVDNIENIQVQFHDFVENASEKVRSMRKELSETHYLTYQFDFVWENWKKKGDMREVADTARVVQDLYSQIGKNSNSILGLQCDIVALRAAEEVCIKENVLLKQEVNQCRVEVDTYKESISYRLGYGILHPLEFFFSIVKKIK